MRAKLLADLAKAGHVGYHMHGDRMGITRDGVADLRWQLLTARVDNDAA
ncbi:hypothetical protein [Amycolatopsis sp. NPDC021455]